jgi:glutathione-regulated potassium-efflux system ancillary protein KefG
MAKVLVLFAHPARHRSRAGAALQAALDGLAQVTCVDLYETYPDLLIDVAAEQARLSAHDALVMQHPFYWYSAPSLMKEWLDLVLEHGFAYGHGATALTGKPWLQAITAGGRASAYAPTGMNRYTLEEFLRPFEGTAHLCGALWQEPFVLDAAHRIDAAALAAEAQRYRTRVQALTQSSEPG